MVTPSERYYAEIFRTEPEQRWFHRIVLRRPARRVIFHAGPLESFTINREINQITNATLVFHDPTRDLTLGMTRAALARWAAAGTLHPLELERELAS